VFGRNLRIVLLPGYACSCHRNIIKVPHPDFLGHQEGKIFFDFVQKCDAFIV
jgi:hypothetical protein